MDPPASLASRVYCLCSPYFHGRVLLPVAQWLHVQNSQRKEGESYWKLTPLFLFLCISTWAHMHTAICLVVVWLYSVYLLFWPFGIVIPNIPLLRRYYLLYYQKSFWFIYLVIQSPFQLPIYSLTCTEGLCCAMAARYRELKSRE